MVMNLESAASKSTHYLHGMARNFGLYDKGKEELRRAKMMRRVREVGREEDILSGSNPPKSISNHQPKTKEVSFV